MKKANILTGVLFLFLAALGYWNAGSMEAKINADNLGPAFWPRCLCIALAFFAVLLILEGVLAKKAAEEASPFHFRSEGFKRVAILLGILIIFVLLIYFLGIFVALLFMIPASMFVFGERNVKLLVIFPIAACVFVYVVFGVALSVPLPMGLVFG